MLRVLRYIIEFVAALVGVSIILGILLAWRLSSSPISSDFLTPYIEAGIEGIVPDSQAQLASTSLTWNAEQREISLHADKITVNDKDGEEIASVPSFDARISALGLIFGQLMPVTLEIEHPQIKLERRKDGAFIFGGVMMSSGDASSSTQSSQTISSVVDSLSRRMSRATLMHKLAVTDAILDIHDNLTSQDWAISIPEISIARNDIHALEETHKWGALDGKVKVEVTQKDTTATLDLHYTYDPTLHQHALSTTFEDLNPAFIAGGHPETLGLGMAAILNVPLTGKIKISFDRNLSIDGLAASVHGDAGTLVYSDFWDTPVPIKSLDVNANYDLKAQQLKVFDTNIDFNGPVLGLTLDGLPPSKVGKDIDFDASLTADNVPMNRYSELWPKPILPDPRYWLVADLRNGVFNHAEVTLKGSLAWHDIGNLSVDDGGGKLVATNGSVTYLDGLPPVEGVNATATFDFKKMDVHITDGSVGNIKLLPFTLEITGLDQTDQDIDIPLQVGGPIPEIFALLDHKPLEYAKALGISPDDISGQLNGLVTFRFPLLKTLQTKDLSIHANADATSVASTKLVPGIAIDQGTLKMDLDTSGFSFTGQALLNKIPSEITWQQSFEPQDGKPLRHAVVTGVVKDDQWNNFGITAFDGSKGPMKVTLDITSPTKTKMIMSGTVDMTPANVNMSLLNWKKAANTPATLKYVANTTGKGPITVSSVVLRGPQLMAEGSATLSPDFSQILSFDFAPFVVGRTNTTLHFAQSFGDGGTLRFDADGSSLDASGLSGGHDPEHADPRPKEYHIKVDKFYMSDVGEIDKVEGVAARDQLGWRSIDFKGLADGDTPLSIELTPQPDGHRTLSITCSDFGKAMKGLGFTDTVKHGALSVTGESTVDAPRDIVGKAKITDFSVEKLPALALLLNATSPFGFSGIITDSIDFSRFSGEFHWVGDELTLTKAHAAGSSIGINVDGKIDMSSGDANLQGTLVPFSTVNNILNYIPILGDLLTGGENQGVLAVSYQIKGPLAAPKVSVNPVSLLTPGFIRNLFFRDDSADDNE